MLCYGAYIEKKKKDDFSLCLIFSKFQLNKAGKTIYVYKCISRLSQGFLYNGCSKHQTAYCAQERQIDRYFVDLH